LCNGQAVSRTTFANLFAECSITYGAGDGVATFNVPDGQGRNIVGAAGSTGRLTTITMTTTAAGGTGGGETETLTLAQLPGGITSVGPPLSVAADTTNSNNIIGSLISETTPGGSFPFQALAGASTAIVPSTGSTSGQNVTSNNTEGGAHPNVQPTLQVGGWIIKT
jgi:microcystin-dependent protein